MSRRVDELLTKQNATVGAFVKFRGVPRRVHEVCDVGVWFEPLSKGESCISKNHMRDFLYYHEAEKFGAVLVLIAPREGDETTDPYEAFELWAKEEGLWEEFLASDSNRMHEIVQLYGGTV